MNGYYEMLRDESEELFAFSCPSNMFPAHFHRKIELFILLDGKITLTFDSGYENIFRLAQVLDMSLDEFVFGYSRFNNTICIKEINDMLVDLSPEEQGMIIGILKAACESMLRRSSK